jgi:predicted ATPase
MRFSKFHLENWRNFTRADVTLQERMFLVGVNATGKSNFLDAFRFLQDLVRIGGGFQKAVADRGGVSRLRCLAARRNADIVIEVAIANGKNEEWEYRLAIAQDNQRRPIVKEEKVRKSGKLLRDRPDEHDRDDKELLRQTHLEQMKANREFREVADFFNTIHYEHLVPQIIREPERSAGRKLDPYGGDFLERIASLPKKTQEARLRRIRETLSAAVPQLMELQIYQNDHGVPHLRSQYEHWRLQEAWQTEVDFSDGTLRLLGLLWSLLDGTGPLLLEEPEMSLHSEIVRYIPQMMAHIQKKNARQILVSTHSSDLLRDEGIAPDEVLLFRPTPEGTHVETGLNIPEVRRLLESGLTVADAVLPHTRPPAAEKLAYLGE